MGAFVLCAVFALHEALYKGRRRGPKGASGAAVRLTSSIEDAGTVSGTDNGPHAPSFCVLLWLDIFGTPGRYGRRLRVLELTVVNYLDATDAAIAGGIALFHSTQEFTGKGLVNEEVLLR
ncbi:hypothetical protein CNYM01_01046 [Colletotrichum nymphaeae SA-01]|uniref:Uncharacterized protein n=1 Tax=Colletotrichum nymphaeae SA-01 TaxID=1460502 RepID=A0A135SEH7_9PEZI|nr:hypothetical protein CNYM01_01046 [Colletotrichum nymphaeae SA-01]